MTGQKEKETFVHAIMGHTEKWKEHKAAWDKARAKGDLPRADVLQYFEYSSSDPRGEALALKFGSDYEGMHECVEHSWDIDEEYLHVDLSKLPEGVKFIRFTLA